MRLSWTSLRFAGIALMLCAATTACHSVPNSGIDPSGEHIFAQPADPNPNVAEGERPEERYHDQPLGQLSCDDVAVQVEPRERVAAVGSEVVLIAGVCGSDGYLRTNRRLEWSIDPGSVGQFVAIGETGFVDFLLGDFNRPRKVTNTYAIGSTLRSNVRLNRGTCQPEDAVYVLRGQGWISLTSSIEGTSEVTVVAPEVYRWDQRTQTAMVHWVDAQWRFPPPAINPAGTKHVFTTTVLRQSNQTPCERWRVRYQIVDGPAAGFSPDGAQTVEVPTDTAGQASVEIFQKEAKHGTNHINIQVIRPGDLPGTNGRQLVVGSGSTMKTWTGADLSVKTTGPAAAAIGGTATYRIDICNPGDLPAKDVVVTNTIPDGLTYQASNPAAEVAGRQLQWRLGEIGARQQRAVEVTFRADKQGSVSVCSAVAAAGGLNVTDCATTTIGTASVDLQVVGPAQTTVGGQASFEIVLTNLSQSPISGLRIRDTVESGLEHRAANAQGVIERYLKDLAPGATQRINVTFNVTKSGRLCHTVEVTGKGLNPITKQSCLMAVGGAASTPGITPPGTAQQQTPSHRAMLAVRATGPQQAAVGEVAKFYIEITNNGDTTEQNIKVIDQFDRALTPTLATDKYKIEQDALVWMIDSLPPNKTTRIDIHCSCNRPALNACNRAVVTAAGGEKFESQACLDIREASTAPANTPPATAGEATETGPDAQPPIANEGLTLSNVGLRNPVPVNQDLTYEMRVTNTGASIQRQLSLTVTLPEGMVFNPIGTVGPESVKPQIEGRTLRFDPLLELKPNDFALYRVRVRATLPGRQFTVRAELSTPTLQQPIVKEENTEVIRQNSGAGSAQP